MENMSTTSELVERLRGDAGFQVTVQRSERLLEAADRLAELELAVLAGKHALRCFDELERENARLRAALANSRDAIDFYEKVQAASQDEKAAVGQDHWNWLIEAARRARAALAAQEKK